MRCPAARSRPAPWLPCLGPCRGPWAAGRCSRCRAPTGDPWRWRTRINMRKRLRRETRRRRAIRMIFGHNIHVSLYIYIWAKYVCACENQEKYTKITRIPVIALPTGYVLFFGLKTSARSTSTVFSCRSSALFRGIFSAADSTGMDFSTRATWKRKMNRVAMSGP